MVIYFKKYVVWICVIAIAVPVIVSTVYPLVTGQIMASSIGGMIALFALFFASMLVAFNIFERKAQHIVEGYIDLYNVDCNPQGLIDKGEKVAYSITYPCNEQGAWFMSYYAQALLDVDQVERAKQIEEGIKQSILAAKKPSQKARILANLVPLEEKLNPGKPALDLIDEGLKYVGSDPSETQFRDFFNTEKKIVNARLSDDQSEIAALDESVRTNDMYPLRLRVEYAFDEARANFRLGNTVKEKENLEFVVKYGNKLALVAQAKKRLAQ